MPAHSKNQHVLATLRRGLGLGQKELAALVGRSKTAIQRIELGSLLLGEELARRIAQETGVDLRWLLAGHYESEPIGAHGRRLTREDFDRHRMWRSQRVATDAEMGRFERWSKGCSVGLAGQRTPYHATVAERRERLVAVQGMSWTLDVTRNGKPVDLPSNMDCKAIARRLAKEEDKLFRRTQAMEVLARADRLVRSALEHKDCDLILWRLEKQLNELSKKHGLCVDKQLRTNGL